MDCIFCKIINKEIPSNIVYEDELVIAFLDTNPKTPVHILVIPKKHIESAHHASKDDLSVIGHIYGVIQQLAEQTGVAENGYRVLTNIGKHGNQTVKHMHFHLLGGRQMQ